MSGADSAIDALTVPRRRDLRGIKATLAGIVPGDTVAATFRSDLFGPFVLTGRVVESGSTGGLLVGGVHLDTGNRNPVPELCRLAVLDEASTETAAETVPQRVSLRHGDVIRAAFVQAPYDAFEITGFAVQARANGDVFAVGGGWFLTESGGMVRARRVLVVDVLCRAEFHRLPVPAPIDRWPEPTGDLDA
ncbi:hypothetical protein [Nocardia puris]|uniref:Uncharacterized protein n=1 Tax=Nocardia puris TaxID=208602 RepID=A0A366DTF3_9NOCA|nr:hypothetical protein [Nocardia puris]RBO92488.1 hypothetical protein DFR74_103131 [Nocardia puris]